jgi:signal transduction histidine kinase
MKLEAKDGAGRPFGLLREWVSRSPIAAFSVIAAAMFFAELHSGWLILLRHPLRERTMDLELANKKLRRLSARLLTIQEEERHRVARDLHDSVAKNSPASNSRSKSPSVYPGPMSGVQGSNG